MDATLTIPELSDPQRRILVDSLAGETCGDSAAMQELVRRGLMMFAFASRAVGSKFYRFTPRGKAVAEALVEQSHG